MTTLSITSTKTMTYDAPEAARYFAVIEALIEGTVALLQAARSIGTRSTVALLRATRA